MDDVSCSTHSMSLDGSFAVIESCWIMGIKVAAVLYHHSYGYYFNVSTPIHGSSHPKHALVWSHTLQCWFYGQE